MKTDEHYIKVCLLNAVFYDYDEIPSAKLLELYKAKYITFNDFKHPKYGISHKNNEKASAYAKNSLGELKQEGYVTVEWENGEYVSRPTQLLFDSDEFPIGGKIKNIDNDSTVYS